MKNTVIIALDDAKVSALKMYLNMKNSSLDEELSKYAEQLYSKIVPQNVRDFIDMTESQQNAKKPKPTSAKATEQP
jgi:hypothetical protein